jgi:hypothetical protein
MTVPNNKNINAEQRLKICRQCEFLQRFSRCAKCGCIMPIKARIPQMHCPIGKW